MKNKQYKQKSFLLPVQGKAILRRGSTAYFQEDMAAYFSEQAISRDINSREIARQISCHKTNEALGIGAYCSRIATNSLFHY